MKIKVTYIVSEINKALAFEWVAERLDRTRFDLRFVLLNDGPSELEYHLQHHGINVKRIHLRKGPGIVITFLALWAHLFFSRPKIVHCHLRYATILGITASYFVGIQTRIHTRHHSSFHHIYFPHAVKYDKLNSRLSTCIVSISNAVTKILVEWEKVDRNKIKKIPHGFDLDYFHKANSRHIDHLRKQYLPDNSAPVIGMISRYIKWKGTIYGIQAFSDVLKKYPNAKLIIANASGPDKNHIEKELSKLPSHSYIEIGFESDLASLYRLFDVFIHVPIGPHHEAFGQVYVEALASGVPSVFTLSGIAVEFIKNERNALVVDYINKNEIEIAICRILDNNGLSNELIENGRRDIQAFGLDEHIKQLENLYNEE